MMTNGTRVEVAERMRGPFDVCECVGHTYLSGTLFGMQVCARDEMALRDGMRRLADLIDPTCTISESYDRNANEARYTCSECGTSWSNYDTVDDGSRYTSGWAVWHNAVPVYVCHCPYCGARIVLGDENDEHR